MDPLQGFPMWGGMGGDSPPWDPSPPPWRPVPPHVKNVLSSPIKTLVPPPHQTFDKPAPSLAGFPNVGGMGGTLPHGTLGPPPHGGQSPPCKNYLVCPHHSKFSSRCARIFFYYGLDMTSFIGKYAK